MTVSYSADPVPYSPGIETPEPDEAETTEELLRTLRKISETTYKDGGHALRSVHAKSHALLEGRLDVLDGLPPELAQGIFARRESYPVMLRLSTNPGDILDDSITVPRGLAMKVLGVEGERLPGAESSTAQDFLLETVDADKHDGLIERSGTFSSLLKKARLASQKRERMQDRAGSKAERSATEMSFSAAC